MDAKSNSKPENNKTETSKPLTNSTDSELRRQDSTMATVTQGTSSQSNVAVDVWSSAVPKVITSERQVSVAVNQKYWNNFYNRVKLGSASEDSKRKARAAVYLYCAINGTSRAGEYSSEVVTADGHRFNSSEIAAACNSKDIRKWMRANADEAINFFRATKVLEDSPIMVSRANDLGGNVDSVIGIVDYVSDSNLLFINEKRLNTTSFNISIQRAAGARGGKSLESVEYDGVERGLAAQDNTSENGNILRL